MAQNVSKSMKIDTHNSFDLRFSSISDINRLITIDYYRLQSILSIIEFHRLGTPGISRKRFLLCVLFHMEDLQRINVPIYLTINI